MVLAELVGSGPVKAVLRDLGVVVGQPEANGVQANRVRFTSGGQGRVRVSLNLAVYFGPLGV